MNVSLSPELEAFVRERVESGLYASASEVIRDGLRLLHEREQLRAMKLEELRREIDKGLEDIEAGRVTELDRQAIERIKQRGRKQLEASKG